MSLGDALAIAAIALAWLLYQLQRAVEQRRDLDSARAVLTAVERGMVGSGTRHEIETVESGGQGWGEWFFGNVWEGDKLEARAREDAKYVSDGSYGQIWVVPTSPLDALIRSPLAGSLILPETIEAANFALFRIGVFNQLVQQKSDFNALHLAEFVDEKLAPERRGVLARAAYMQSHMLHGSGIGAASADGGWYHNLKEAIHRNSTRLDDAASRRWWETRSVFLGAALLVLTIILVAYQAAM